VVDIPRLAWLRVLWDEVKEKTALKSPVFPAISGCFRLFPLIFRGGGSGVVETQGMECWSKGVVE